MGWFGEQPDGLNRYFHDLVSHLPGVGVDVAGLVGGSRRAADESGGQVQAFAASDAALLRRWRGVRAAVCALPKSDRGPVVSHFALYALPVLDVLGTRPLVVHFHGPWAMESAIEGSGALAVRVKAALERRVYQRAARVIVLSEAFGTLVHERYGVPRARIRVVPGGVDVPRFAGAPPRAEARRLLGWPEDRRIVLAVRRLVRRTGVDALIAAAARIRAAVPDVLILVAGRGPLLPELAARVAEDGLSDCVRLLGFVPDDQLPLAYRSAELTVVPTVALEGFGLIVAESLAAGTPALVTPVGSLPEVVAPLAPDLVLASSGPEAIADGIIAALDGRRRMPSARDCERFAADCYDWPRVAARVRGVYEEAMA